MKISDQEQRNVWLSFASAAVSATDPEDSIKDIVEDTADLADALLDEYLSRFGKGTEEPEDEKPRRRINKRR